jgi:hypothetical protein
LTIFPQSGRELFFERILGPVLGGAALGVVERGALKRLDRLTPGDFKVVWQKNAFQSAAQATAESLLAQLRQEMKAKASAEDSGRRIGF